MLRITILIILMNWVYSVNAQSDFLLDLYSAIDNDMCFIQIDTSKIKIDESGADTIMNSYLKLSNHNELRLVKEFIGIDKKLHKIYKQYYKGIEIENTDFALHFSNSLLILMNGNVKKIENLNMKTNFNKLQILENLINELELDYVEWGKIDKSGNLLYIEDKDLPPFKLKILKTKSNKPDKFKAVYKFKIKNDSSEIIVYYDINSNKVIKRKSTLQKAINGQADTKYSGIDRTIQTEQSGSDYILHDLSRGDGIITRDLNTGNLPAGAKEFTDKDNNWETSEFDNEYMDIAALDVHWGMQKTYDYFYNKFGRNSYDGQGSQLISYVHYFPNWEGAAWNHEEYYFAFGDGKEGADEPYVTLDIIAHEFGHALCQFSRANLDDQGEEGALSEGLADIWGACVENYAVPNDPNKDNWHALSELNTPLDRSLSDPNSISHYIEGSQSPFLMYPDTYQGNGWYDGNEYDNGGIHHNSTVISHWFYILTNGNHDFNDHSNCYDVNGIGIDKAAKIVYLMETAYLNPGSDFAAARFASVQAAKSLFGNYSGEAYETENAWYAVGVGPKPVPKIYDTNPICVTGKTLKVIPEGITRTWSIPSTSSRYFSIEGSNTNSSVYVKALMNGVNGEIRINVTDNCETRTKVENRWVGKPAIPKTNPTGYPTISMQLDTYFNVWITEMKGASTSMSPVWTASGSLEIDHTTPNGCTYHAYTTGTGNFYVKTRNICGYSPSGGGTVSVYSGSGGGGGGGGLPRPLSVSPNPANDYIEAYIKDLTEEEQLDNEKLHIKIVNSNSIPVYNETTQQKKFQINTSSFPEGVYYLLVQYKNQKYSTTILISR